MLSVLYVDDEPDLLELGKIFLEREGTISVTTCESGTGALGLLKTGTFDAVIADYQMPEMDGIALLREIRKSSGIPFILFTGRGREEIVIDAINSGADFYLQKGGDPTAQFAELNHKIHQSVSRARAENALHRRLALIRRASDTSTRFIRLRPEEIDRAVADLLGGIGQQMGVDRCYLAHRSGPSGRFEWIHEWVREGVAPLKDSIGQISGEVFSSIQERTGTFEPVVVPTVAALPEDPDDALRQKRVLETIGIQSYLLLPLTAGPAVIGLLGLDTVRAETAWPEEDIDILRIYGQIIAGALSRKETDRAMQESGQLYRTVFESTGTAMMILNEDRTIAVVNREFERISGYSRAEVEGKVPWTQFVSPGDVGRMKQYHALRRADPAGVPKNYEFSFLSRGGEVISTYITVEMIPGTTKSTVSLIDISKEKAAQQELADSEEKFRNLTESLAEGIYMMQDDRFIYVNPAFAKIFGRTVDEVLALPDYSSLFVPEDLPKIREALTERLAQRKDSERYMRRALLPDRTIVPVVIHGSRTRYQGKQAIIGIVTRHEDTCLPPPA